MPPGRTGARNYRHRRPFASSSDESDSSPEPMIMKQAPKAPPPVAKRARSRSHSPLHMRSPPRRTGHPRSLSRGPHNRPLGDRSRSPPMKHGPLPSHKHSHSPRHRSLSPSRRPVPHRSHGPPSELDRSHHSRRSHEMERRRHHSRSPLGPRPPKETPPGHHSARHPSMRGRGHPMYDSSPSKDRRFRYRSNSPGGSGPHKSYMNSNADRNFPKGVERFNRAGGDSGRGYPDMSKAYVPGPTLDERFRSVGGDANRGIDSRVRYTREDLAKITIDIRRNVREPSPTIRHIINPNEIKIVRRPNEGSRPIFDREEIKQAPKDMRDDAYCERRVIAFVKTGVPDGGMYSSSNHQKGGHGGIENYQVSRQKFGNSLYGVGPGPTLSERWQNYESRKDINRDSIRDSHGFGRPRPPDGYRSSQDHIRTRSLDRDIGPHRPPGDRYFDGKDHFHGHDRPEHRSENMNFQKPLPNDPSDLRHSLAIRRKDGSLQDARERLMKRRVGHHGERDRIPDLRGDPRRGLIGKHPERPREGRSGGSSRSIGPDSSLWERDSFHGRERRSSRDDKLPDFSQRPERFKYQPWLDKPEVIPKGPSYFEHDDRGESTFRGRARGRILRGRGFRSTFRAGLRSFRGRSSFFRGSSSTRGRGYSSRIFT